MNSAAENRNEPEETSIAVIDEKLPVSYRLDDSQILARYGKTFRWAQHFLPTHAAASAARLYAFCRYLDDVADSGITEGRQQLVAIQARLSGEVPLRDVQVLDKFQPWARSAGIPETALADMLDGFLGDQLTVALEDEADLIRYAYRVAGTVGLMMCPLLGARDPRARAFAIDLGIAMQLTNIARDVLEDAQMGRRYLPGSWCGHVKPEQIVAAAAANNLEQVRLDVSQAVDRLLQLAEKYYESGISGLRFLPVRSHLAIAVAAFAYRAIGHRLRHRGLCWWRGRVSIGLPGKLWHSLVSLQSLAVRFTAEPVHDAGRHLHLIPLPGFNDHSRN